MTREFAVGNFGAGRFNLQGSAAGDSDANFTTEENAAGPASLNFTVAAADLSPNESVYAPFAVRLDASSTTNGIVTVSQESSANVTELTYELVTAH